MPCRLTLQAQAVGRPLSDLHRARDRGMVHPGSRRIRAQGGAPSAVIRERLMYQSPFSILKLAVSAGVGHPWRPLTERAIYLERGGWLSLRGLQGRDRQHAGTSSTLLSVTDGLRPWAVGVAVSTGHGRSDAAAGGRGRGPRAASGRIRV
jgi:hypothetical protein